MLDKNLRSSVPGLLLVVSLALAGCSTDSVHIDGSLRAYQPVTLSFDGPSADEAGERNPFTDFRLDVTFVHEASGSQVDVPGYFAADGDAAETSAQSGSTWRVQFVPHDSGNWVWIASFLSGPEVAINEQAGSPTAFHGQSGVLEISDADPDAPGHLAKGMLRTVGERYLRFDDGSYFLKGGSDSPENLLGYVDFDGTRSLLDAGIERQGEAPTSRLHRYEPHVHDWNARDPEWQNGKGKGLIGGLNYLASKGLNSVSFLTMNVEGDGQDVWPWIAPDVRDRFDVSKLAQWEIVFNHADRLGLFLHFKTQETENDTLLDGGLLGRERKLYYRELIARFAHHQALNWNLGEENDVWEELDDPGQELLKQYAAYIHGLDPYDHPVVVHTYPGQQDVVYTPLLGDASELDGVSIQTHFDNVYAETLKWVTASTESGKPWIVANDEQGHYSTGVKPDGPDSNRDEIRRETLWGNLMAGGAGVEYYFGYMYPQTDLNLEDWRSRDLVWEDVARALEFFRTYVPFQRAEPLQGKTSNETARVFALPNCPCVVQLPDGGTTSLDVPAGQFSVRWFDPSRGGNLRRGTVDQFAGPGPQDLGLPPSDPAQDWVVLVSPIQ